MNRTGAGGRNHFNADQKTFPSASGTKIDTEKFLDAAAGAVKILEKQGKVFTPLAMDMNGNVKKLTKQYNTDKIKNSTLQDMILAEKSAGKNFAILALLWFTRSLHFLELIMEKVLADHEAGLTEDNTKEHIVTSYNETLKPYHGWMNQKAILMGLKVLNIGKMDFYNALNETSTMDDFISDMKVFLNTLKENRIEIQRFYNEHNLEDKTKV